MSTRSLICKENKDHTYTGIYCHWDGYPSNNGKILAEYYSDRNKVEELLKLGDLSYLDVNISPANGKVHTFDTPVKGVCVAYHRDRGEDYNEPHLITPKEAKNSWCEYMYVFGLDGKWRYFDLHTCVTELKNLPDDIIPNSYYSETKITFEDILNGVRGQNTKSDNNNQEPRDSIRLKIAMDISMTRKDIDDIMTVALEGGITYWCNRTEVVGDYLGEYASEQISRGGTIRLYVPDEAKWFELTLENFLKGLEKIVAERGLDVIYQGSIDAGEIDAGDADEIIQYAIFGEIIYG